MPEIFLYNKDYAEKPKLNVWCAFPAVKNFGMAALGYLSVFKQIDTTSGILAERIFTDTKTTVIKQKDVDLISFSFSFELDYLGILKVLEQNKIPFLAKERNEKHPLIYGGGPVLTANPEPFAEIFDFIMVGDAEPNLKKLLEILKDNKEKTKLEKLKLIENIEGIYIPSFKTEHYKVKKATSQHTNCTYTPILTDESFFSNTFIIEVERGCPQNCAFCIASYTNKPVRFFDYEDIINKIELGLKYTNKIALLGALICAHPRIDDICQYIINKVDEGKNIEVTVSSLRADYVSDKTLEMLHKCGQKTATIAIEAGNDRLRNVINKRLKKEDILNVIDKMYNHGFTGVKIYGIVGLPTETQKDIDDFISLCKEIKQKYKGFTITPSFSTFVPKAQSPFQYAKREDTKSLEKKNEYIKKEFAKIGIKARTSSVKWDYIQALLSRGDRKLTPYIIEVYKKGGTLGDFKSVYKEFEEKGLLPPSDDIALKEFSFDALPWNFIVYENNKISFEQEYKKLLKK